MLSRFILKVYSLCCLFFSIVAASPPNSAYYDDIIYHDLMVSQFYAPSQDDESVLSSPPSSNGAISVNIDYENGISNKLYVEQQRYGAEWIAAGIVQQNTTKVDIGLRVMNWVFTKIDNDGPEIYTTSEDAVHSTSLFLEAATRSALLLLKAEEDGIVFDDSIVDYWKPHLLQMAEFVSEESAQQAYGRDANLEPFGHRYFLRAAGIQGAASLYKDDDETVAAATTTTTTTTTVSLSEAATSLVEEGLAIQTPDGIMMERGGFDFNYQAIGLCYLGRWKYLSNDDTTTSDISNAMMLSLPWFTDRVDSLGNVDTSDSTRINEPARSGRPKNLDYKTIAQGFLVASALTLEEEEYMKLATLLAKPIRPIVEYKFEGTADGQKSTGVDTTGQANLFCRTQDNGKNSDPLGIAGSGLTSGVDDYALQLTSTSSEATMGSGGQGPFCRTDDNVDSLDGLMSFTMLGYYRTPSVMTNNIELFKTNKFKLTVVNNGKLRLFVDSDSGQDSVVASHADWTVQDGEQWGFFAVTYDGTQHENNVHFYTLDDSAAEGDQVKLSSTQTLDRGQVEMSSSRLYINRQNRPMVGYLDNMRIYGSTIASGGDDGGVLSIENLQDLYTFDTIISSSSNSDIVF